MNEAPLAALRRLGIRIEPVRGEPRIRLWDPLGVSGERDGFLLTAEEWRIARSLDGRRSGAEIAEHLAAAGGATAVSALANRLAAALLLEDEAFERAASDQLTSFRCARERVAVGSGTEYPRDPFELRLEVAGLVANDWDMPFVESLVAAWTPAAPYRKAAALYARTWSALRSRERTCQRVLLVGAIDCELGRLLVPLDRDLATPIGTVRVDHEGLAALEVLSGRDVLAHTTSPVLERQALFQRVILPDVPVVAVLVPALSAEWGEASPADLEEVESAVDALARVLALPGSTAIVCAADLQRLTGTGREPTADGPPYGDGPPHGDRGRFVLAGPAGRRLRDTDTRVVDAATRLAPEELWSAARDGGGPLAAARLIAPYLVLRLLARCAPTARGSTLGYLQMPGAFDVTTAASVVFH